MSGRKGLLGLMLLVTVLLAGCAAYPGGYGYYDFPFYDNGSGYYGYYYPYGYSGGIRCAQCGGPSFGAIREGGGRERRER